VGSEAGPKSISVWTPRSVQTRINFTGHGKRTLPAIPAVHHTVSSPFTPIEEAWWAIDKFHRDRGWGGFGYHALVNIHGDVLWTGNPAQRRACVCDGNHEVLCVAAQGDFSFLIPPEPMLNGIAWVIAEWRKAEQATMDITGHRDWGDKYPCAASQCPGNQLYARLGSVQERSLSMLKAA
jgi:hypothetical protein